MGVYEPRNFDPYSMPYFSHEYQFRERCWNVEQTDEQFRARMARRLFDDDMPPESIDHYLQLAEFCPNPQSAEPEAIERVAAFVSGHVHRGTPRNQDTLARMQEALAGIRKMKTDTEAPAQ
jgi:hypothetical protein